MKSIESDTQKSQELEPSTEGGPKRLDLSIESWLSTLEKNDPENARGLRLAHVNGWTWEELMRYRLAGEYPKGFSCDPVFMREALKESAKPTDAEIDERRETIRNYLEQYKTLQGTVTINLWERIPNQWETLATSARIKPLEIQRVGEQLRHLIHDLKTYCFQYAAMLAQEKEKNITAIEISHKKRHEIHDEIIRLLNQIQRLCSIEIPQQFRFPFPIQRFHPRALEDRDTIGKWAVLTNFFIKVTSLEKEKP